MLKLLQHPGVAVVITLICGVFLLSLHKSSQKSTQSTQTVTKAQEKVAKLEEEVTSLQEKVDKSGSPLEQEKIIRNQLLMQKPGEYVVQIPRSTQKEQEIITSDSATPLQAWKKLLWE
jgi:cell division protein FtsB